MAFPYVQQAWADADVTKPLSAARMANIENAIRDSQQGPAVRVFHNATQATTSALQLVLAFNSERFDQAFGSAAAQHDNVTNNSRLTALYAGVYMYGGIVTWASNPSNAHIDLRVNGATIIGSSFVVSDYRSMSIAGVIWSMAVNDYCELAVTQSSGGALNVNSNAEFWACRVA